VSKTPKKRKFQIEPNSLSASEENATRNVLRRLRNPSTEVEEAIEIEEIEFEPQKLEVVPPSVVVVNHISENMVNHSLAAVVNHKLEDMVYRENSFGFTTPEIVVNNPTTVENFVNKTTTKSEISGKQDELYTTNKNVVNHKQRDWSTTNKRRSSYGSEVESYRTSGDFKRKIKVFCAEMGVDKQDFYRIVVNHYFDTVVNQINKNVVDKSTLDDLKKDILWKTNFRIINLYLHYNLILNEKSKWSMKDDEAGKRFNDVDIRLVELGIIQTQSNKGFSGKINTFGYYGNEIENFVELKMPSEALDTMLNINRQRWRQSTGREIDLTFLNK